MIREESVTIGPNAIARVVVLDRPEKKNAISAEGAAALADAIERASGEEEVRAVVVTAVGDVFAAGGDLDEIRAGMRAPDGADRVIAMGRRMQVMETCSVPVIAAVNGDVYGGGCELVLLADIVIAEEQARFSFRHARMGLAPAWGGTGRLVTRVGPSMASQLLFTSELVGAERAARVGLVTECVPRGEARARALRLATEIAKAPRASVEGVKRSVASVLDVTRAASRAGEEAVFKSLFGKPAHRAAMTAPRADKKKLN